MPGQPLGDDPFDGHDRERWLASDLRARLRKVLLADDGPVLRFVGSGGETTVGMAAFARDAAGFLAACRGLGLGAGDVVAIAYPTGARPLAAWAGAVLGGLVPLFAPPNDPRAALRGPAEGRGVAGPEALADTIRRRPLLSTWAPAEPEFDDAAAYTGVPALLQRSSGTTGPHKPIAIDHRRALAQLWGLGRALELRRSDVIASFLPLHHDMGLVSTVLLPLCCGISLVRVEPRLWRADATPWVWSIARHKATLAWVPPAALARLVRRVAPADERAMASLRQIVCGGEPLGAEVVDAFLGRFGAACKPEVIGAGYGAAENVAAITQTPVARGARRLTVARDRLAIGRKVATPAADEAALTLLSCGVPIEGTTVTVLDADDREVDDGVVGRLRLAGDCVAPGYLGDDHGAALVDGGFDTGDIGLRDGGEIFVLGRADELIELGGKLVLPHEAEAALADHDDIEPGRCAAVWSERSGFAVLVELRPARLFTSAEQLAAFVADVQDRVEARVGHRPSTVRVLPQGSLLKSSSGKTARAANRDALP